MWNNAKPKLSDSRLIKQWHVCQTCLSKIVASNIFQQTWTFQSWKTTQKMYLSYHSMSEQSFIIWWVGKRVGGTEPQGEHATFSGWTKSSPTLPYLHTSINSIKKLESNFLYLKNLSKRREKQILLSLTASGFTWFSKAQFQTGTNMQSWAIKSQVESSALHSVCICDVITQTMFKGHWGHIWHRWLKTAWGLLKQKH